jgi:tetratricopeptide (TPR) repeat protein
MGDCARAAGDYEMAVSYFKEAIKNSKEENDHTLAAYIGCCDAYLLKGDYKSALDECSGKLEALPGGVYKAKAWYDLGVINLKNNKPREAEDYFKKTLATIDGYGPGTNRRNYTFNFDLYSALAHYSLGAGYSLNKNYEQALIEMKKAIELAGYQGAYGLTDRIDSRYLIIAARYELIEILEAQGEKASAEKELKDLADFIGGIFAQEKSMIEDRKFDVYIEGKPLEEILKKLAAHEPQT